MFCKNCGSNLNESMQFCPYCGAEVSFAGNPAPAYEPASVISYETAYTPAPMPYQRKWNLPFGGPNEAYRHPFTENPVSRSISTTVAFLNSAKAFKDSQYPYSERVEQLEREENDIHNWLNDKGTRYAVCGAGLFLLFIMVFKWAISLYSNRGFFGSMPILGTFVLLCSFGVLAVTVYCLNAFRKKFTDKDKKQQRLQEIDMEICSLYAEFQSQIDNENSPVRLNAMNYAWLFPAQDASAYQIAHMIDALQTGRVGSFQDALLNYDRCMHEMKMENTAAQTAEYARRSAEAAERTADASETTAAAAVATMNMNAVRMWA